MDSTSPLFHSFIVVDNACVSQPHPSNCFSYQVFPLFVVMCMDYIIPSLFNTYIVVISD